MKVLFLYAFIIGSAAAVAADDHKEHGNIDTPHLRATKGSASDHATATGLFETELESDVSAADGTMSLEELELALEGFDGAQREIQLSAYLDFTQNQMSMEEINEKYLSGNPFDLNYKCCKNRNPFKCGWGLICKSRCEVNTHQVQNGCCAPEDRGTKKWAWERCKQEWQQFVQFVLLMVPITVWNQQEMK